MLSTILLITLSVIVLTAFAAIFSAAETALTSSSKAKLNQMAKDGNKKAILGQDLQRHVGLSLSSVLLCNTFINLLSSSLVTDYLTDLFGSEWVLISSLFMSFFIVVYAETLPKIIAVQAPERMLLFVIYPLRLVFFIFRPITKVINWIARAHLRWFGMHARSADHEHATLEELRGVIDMHMGPGQDVPHERAMLKSILDLGTVHVEEIMVHRKNVTMINADDAPESILDQVLSSPFTRLPLWRGNMDNIIGVVNTKALLRAVRAHQGALNDLDITETVTQPWFVPESTDLLDQLQAFRQRREHFGFVVDEYGSYLGIVTLEDILEEIVGDIDDEHDIRVRGIRPQEDGSFIVDGTVTLRDINRQLNWELPDEEASTVAGLMLYKIKMIPDVGQKFVIDGFKFEILRRHRNQITLIRIEPPTTQEDWRHK